MWVRAAAIRPVPSYAVVHHAVIESVEDELSTDTDEERSSLEQAFGRFDRDQPHLAARVARLLAKPIDETALALGYFLSMAVYLSFERAFGDRLRLVSEDDVSAAEASLTLEEELRATHGDQPIDVDDVVAREQPNLMAFVHHHIENALDVTAHAEAGLGHDEDIDVDDVHAVYRVIIVLTLALSQAVRAGAVPEWPEN